MVKDMRALFYLDICFICSIQVQMNKSDLQLIEPRDSIMHDTSNENDSNTLEARRTLIDAYLYQNNDQTASDMQFSSFGKQFFSLLCMRYASEIYE